MGCIDAKKSEQELGNEKVFKVCPGHTAEITRPAPRIVYLEAVG